MNRILQLVPKSPHDLHPATACPEGAANPNGPRKLGARQDSCMQKPCIQDSTPPCRPQPAPSCSAAGELRHHRTRTSTAPDRTRCHDRRAPPAKLPPSAPRPDTRTTPAPRTQSRERRRCSLAWRQHDRLMPRQQQTHTRCTTLHYTTLHYTTPVEGWAKGGGSRFQHTDSRVLPISGLPPLLSSPGSRRKMPIHHSPSRLRLVSLVFLTPLRNSPVARIIDSSRIVQPSWTLRHPSLFPPPSIRLSI